MDVLQAYWLYLVAGSIVLALLSLIFAIVALSSTGSLRKRFRRFKSIHETADLDRVYQETLGEVQRIQSELAEAQSRIQRLQEAMKYKVSSAKVLRYNAFNDMGSDLSYSVALLDDHQNGVVLSSIYGREESRTYAKPITQGQSSYTLTEEEQHVIRSDASQSASKRPTTV